MTPLDFHWPTPPFHLLSDGVTGLSSCECTVETIDRKSVTGVLTQFDSGKGIIRLMLPQSDMPVDIPLNKVRVVSITQPLMLQQDKAAIVQGWQ
jgi:hypothetical protein